MTRYRKMIFAAALLALVSGPRANIGEQWISIAVETLRESPQASDGGLAMVATAIARAFAGAQCSSDGTGAGSGDADTAGNRQDSSAAQRERCDAAVAVAAFAVLESLQPERREHLETRLALAFSYIPETSAKAEGAALGRRIGNEVVAAAR